MSEPGIYPEAVLRSSPNCNERPVGIAIKLLVLHNISLPPKLFDTPFIDDLFMNRLDGQAHPYFTEIAHFEVSAHCLIERTGRVIQYVPFEMRAWHAGVSIWQGQEKVNDFSIGIELEGCDTEPFTQQQYLALEQITTFLKREYPTIEAVCGHSDIAPGRKTDPGPCFEWCKITHCLPHIA